MTSIVEFLDRPSFGHSIDDLEVNTYVRANALKRVLLARLAERDLQVETGAWGRLDLSLDDGRQLRVILRSSIDRDYLWTNASVEDLHRFIDEATQAGREPCLLGAFVEPDAAGMICLEIPMREFIEARAEAGIPEGDKSTKFTPSPDGIRVTMGKVEIDLEIPWAEYPFSQGEEGEQNLMRTALAAYERLKNDEADNGGDQEEPEPPEIPSENIAHWLLFSPGSGYDFSEEDWAEVVARVRRDGRCRESWSFGMGLGDAKNGSRGRRAVMMRQGDNPGVVGLGTIVEPPKLGSNGKASVEVELEWAAEHPPGTLSREGLETTLPGARWRPRGNGEGLLPAKEAPMMLSLIEREVRRRRAPWSEKLHRSLAEVGLDQSPNVVLEGVPGTGKTYMIERLLREDPGQQPAFVGRGKGRHAITLHPATSYEDFVEGLRPGRRRTLEHEPWFQAGGLAASREGFIPLDKLRMRESGQPDPVTVCGRDTFLEAPGEGEAAQRFAIHDGFFLRVCREASHYPSRDFMVLLDEINRCNVPKVFGDLLTTVERSKRAHWKEDEHGGYWDLSKVPVVALPYSKRLFFVPDNVFVVATMNTTDRSVAPLDAALRRRFGFVRLWPLGFEDPKLRARLIALDRPQWPSEQTADGEAATGPLIRVVGVLLDQVPKRDGAHPPQLVRSVETWALLNAALLRELGPDGMLGHSYLFDLAAALQADTLDRRWRGRRPDTDAIVVHHWNHHILPQLADILEVNNSAHLVEQQGDSALLKTFGAIQRKWSAGFEWKLEGSGLLRRVDLHLPGEAR